MIRLAASHLDFTTTEPDEPPLSPKEAKTRAKQSAFEALLSETADLLELKGGDRHQQLFRLALGDEWLKAWHAWNFRNQTSDAVERYCRSHGGSGRFRQ